ncbi:anti-sigma B factor RsbW [bacterium]|nr:anti-sigma B factor RsbW [bacterium]
MANSPVVTIEIPSESSFVGVVRLAISGVASRMNFSIDEIEDIKVAVSEACTNAVQHAYGTDPGIVTVRAILHPDKLELVVEDSGKGFDTGNVVSSKRDGANDSLFGLGLGLTFIKSLMDYSEVTSVPGTGTTVRMEKNVPVPAS